MAGEGATTLLATEGVRNCKSPYDSVSRCFTTAYEVRPFEPFLPRASETAPPGILARERATWPRPSCMASLICPRSSDSDLLASRFA